MSTPWTAKVVTLFPDMFPGHLGASLAGRALEAGAWRLETVDMRAHAIDKRGTVDDSPFGGGAGMVLRPDVVAAALQAAAPRGRTLFLSPRGRPLTQALVRGLVATPIVTLVCGRYEGIDQRVIDAFRAGDGAEEVSIGDYVLSGGEPAALIVIDACVRLLPGTVGNAETPVEESFEQGLLEYPHFTRPAQWRDPFGVERTVPEVLVSGHHGRVTEWRRAEARSLTESRRPDLLLQA